jgi:pimeloyl-ACP methyl ester carboxylesterase
MVEHDLHVQAHDNRLAGTLCLPSGEGRFPVVLMAHGSGPLDRDENIKGQRLDIFNAVAHRLATSGIASVRFDKRGCGASEGDYYTAGHHDFADDVVCWYDELQRAEFSRPGHVFLLGHSEGCLVAAHAVLRRPDVAGVVMLCPSIEPMEDILIRQARQIEREVEGKTGVGALVQTLVALLVGGPVANQQRLIRKVKASTTTSIRLGFQRIPAKWFRELLDVDAAQVFGRIACPMLLVGGEKDLQCDPADVPAIAALAQGPVEQHVVADMTHLLRCDDQPPTLLGSRRLLARPVEPELLEIVAAWVRARSASEARP